jgi:hypothetical protein
MAKVFISYRRADNAAGYAMDLARILREAFGERHVFRDMRSIPPGVDFGAFIREALRQCSVMLVVIGRHWALERSDDGRPRLFDPGDWVRIEVASALAAPGVRVIPLLVGGGTLPRPEALPQDLQPLLARNAVSLDDRKWEADVAALIVDLEQVPGLRPWWQRLRRQVGGPAGRPGRLRRVALVGALIVVTGLAIAGAVVDSLMLQAPGVMLDVSRQPPGELAPAAIGPIGLPPVVTKGAPAEPPPSPLAAVAGLWMDGQGNRFHFSQDGDAVTIEQVFGMAAGMGRGDGLLDGRAMAFDFYVSGVHSSSGMVVLSPDGRTMQGQVTDSFTGISVPLYLWRL